VKVKFVPQNVEFEIKPGQSVMHLAEDNGIYVKSVCRGVPSCAECRVRIVEGESNVFPPAGEELSLIGTGWFIDRRRLACQMQCLGDITVDMSEQLAKQQGLIGGRKSKLAKAVGDRIEDETVIRDSSAESRGGGIQPVNEIKSGPQPRSSDDQPPREGGGRSGRGKRSRNR
jgi:ferredoxin